MPVITVEQKIMQAYKEGKEFGILEERRRVRMAVDTVPVTRVSDFKYLDTASAAMAATAWNDCRETLLKAIGVHA